METNGDETTDSESIDQRTASSEKTHGAPDNGDSDSTSGWGGLPISRRNAILTGIGIGGLGLFGSQSASADHLHPVTQWQRHQTAQEKYELVDLAALNMAVMDHEAVLEDFEGSGLSIEEELKDGETLNRLTINLDEGELDRRYLSWHNDDKKLDFTGAAEWENELDDFDGSTSPNSAGGTASVAIGGDDNDASGAHSTVAGGEGNTASGAHSFAAGEGANADEDGSFVWATGLTDPDARGANSVLFQAGGGAHIQKGDLDVEDGAMEAETDIASRSGDVSADAGNVTANDNVTAQNGDVTADSGDVTADQNVTARNGDVSADGGNVTANDDVTAQNGDVTADSGDVTADQDVTARTGNVEADSGHVIANDDVEATFGDIKAINGDVEGQDLIANSSVTSPGDLLLDPPSSNQVESTTDLRVDGDLHVTGTKHFVTAVDTPAGSKQVTYTSVEAGKPRTEASDVAELSDGRATIDLPEHFAMVTSENEPLSVQVTPYANEQVHPQVVARDRDRIVVEDMGDGPDEYTFAYTVKGVRKGFENEPVIREQ